MSDWDREGYERRERARRRKTENLRFVGKKERERVRLALVDQGVPLSDEGWLPKTRGDCQGTERPCPLASCRYHVFLDVTEIGNIVHNFPGVELENMPAESSCALDIADGGSRTLEDIGVVYGISRERVRQVIEKALLKLSRRITPELRQDFIEYLTERANAEPTPWEKAIEDSPEGTGDEWGGDRKSPKRSPRQPRERTPEVFERMQKVVEFVKGRGPCTMREIAEAMGMVKHRSFGVFLQDMKREGKLVVIGRTVGARWDVPREGE